MWGGVGFGSCLNALYWMEIYLDSLQLTTSINHKPAGFFLCSFGSTCMKSS